MNIILSKAVEQANEWGGGESLESAENSHVYKLFGSEN